MSLEPIPHSLLISLSTYPDFHTDNYLNSIVSNLEKIRTSRKDMFELDEKEYNNFFSPLVYTIFGYWDLCVLAVSDNSEIVTKVIQPDLDDNYKPEGQITSKLYSGISYNKIGSDFSEFMNIKESTNSPYIGIVNLKFSNKWILPNGQKLTSKFLEFINSEIQDLYFFPVHTFNTYEVSIVFLGNSLLKIAQTIFKIRQLKVSKITSEKELNRYEFSSIEFEESHLFVDTQSYFGAKLKPVENSNNSEDASQKWDLENKVDFEDIEAVFEFEAKPGHSNDLKNILIDLSGTKDFKMWFQSGQYDFLVSWNYVPTFFNKLFDALKDQKSELRKHIRNHKTHLLFPFSDTEESFRTDEETHFRKYFNLEQIKDKLKAIKVSKSLRNQIVKLFYSYQNALLNKVTYITFIDLYYFVKKLEDKISYFEIKTAQYFDLTRDEENSILVTEIERELNYFVDLYEDAYYLRYVNDRSIIDVQDFLIPHNTQLQTVIGFYDSYVKCILSSLAGPEFGDGLILTFDDHETEVNEISIKLLSNNLFEPGLIFTALSKEITTICFHKKIERQINYSSKFLRSELSSFFTKFPEKKYYVYKDFLHSFGYHYGALDYLRYKYFFKKDFDLFVYYHLGFMMQFPKAYNNTGNYDNFQFLNETFRLLILVHVINHIDGDDFSNKLNDVFITPELRSSWHQNLDILKCFLEDFRISVSHDSKNIAFSIGHLVSSFESQISFNKLHTSVDEIDIMASEYIDISYSFMKKIYDKCNRVYCLSRTWESGQVNRDFLKNKTNIKEPFFLFDSHGGVFFKDFYNLSKYTIERNIVFEDLRDKSIKYKSILYKKIVA